MAGLARVVVPGHSHHVTQLGAGRLHDRQVWRDRRLMALAAHKRKAARQIGS